MSRAAPAALSITRRGPAASRATGRRAVFAPVAVLLTVLAAPPGSAGAAPTALVGEHHDLPGARGCPDRQGRNAVDDAALPSPAQLDRLAAESMRRWRSSPHGGMLLRILPQRLRPSSLPEAGSVGARLTGLYCVQCHHLPSPAMHDAASWSRIVERMVARMRGEGNMGDLMAGLMLGVDGQAAPPLAAPSDAQARQIGDYLARHALEGLDPGDSAALRDSLASEDGRAFVAACSQCHMLPDPSIHSADEWPAIVRRMQENMAWMNRIAPAGDDPREPRPETSVISDFLSEHAPQRMP